MILVPSGSDRRVALLVDGDNLSTKLAGPILGRAERLGRVDVRRAYAAEPGFRAWEDVPGFRPIRVGGAKNGTDLLLCIDVVELACGGGFGAFVIASDDRDFGHLAHWLRERGMFVLGLGTAKAVAGWRAACSEFEVLDALGPPRATPVAPPKPQAVGELSSIDLRVSKVIATEGTDGAMGIGQLGVRMGSAHGVTLGSIGAANWRAYFAAHPHLYLLDPKGPSAQVRWVGPKTAP